MVKDQLTRCNSQKKDLENSEGRLHQKVRKPFHSQIHPELIPKIDHRAANAKRQNERGHKQHETE